MIGAVVLISVVALGAVVLKGGFEVKPIPADPANASIAADHGDANMAAMLAVVRWSEGTAQRPDPYSVTYGYGTPLHDLFVNPWDSGQMQSIPGPSGSTSACGAYQFEPETWSEACAAIGQTDQTFDPATQDACATWLISVKRGADQLVRAGQLHDALDKLSWEWASLPPSRYKQPVRSYEEVAAEFQRQGGVIANG